MAAIFENDDDYSLWSNEFPCCHEKDCTENKLIEKMIKRTMITINASHLFSTASACLVMIYSHGRKECPCCHGKGCTDNKGIQKVNKRRIITINAFI